MSDFNKVIGIGLPKTGTSSLTHVLNNNDIPTLHFGSEACSEIWEKLPKGIYKYDIMEQYIGITNAFDSVFPQLDITYPNSRFIYTVRSKDGWMDSARKHWEWMLNNKASKPEEMYQHLITFGTFYFNESRFSFVYDNHRRMVKDYFKDREQDVLEIDVTTDPKYVHKVCEFLSIPVKNATPVHANRDWR